MPAQSTLAVASRKMPAFPEFIAMMAALMALTAFSIDIMLPALPQIDEMFDITDPNARQLVVTDYVLGFAAGQIIYGPLSDRFGRRAVLLFGLGLYAAASFLCMVAGSFEMLLAARFIQGVANASPRVIAIAIVRDIYGGRRMAEVMSFVMMVFIIVPVIAPSVGGFWLVFGSWHLIFGFLFALSVGVFFWMLLRLPETRHPEDRAPLSFRWLVHAFAMILKTPQTLGYTLATGAVFGSMMSYINSSQQIFTEVYGVGDWFPVLFGCVALALVFASFCNSQLVGRLGMRRLSHGAVVGFVAVSAVHVVLVYTTGDAHLGIFVVLIALNLFCFGFIMPNFNSLAMEPMGHIAGTASSFVGAATTGIAAGLGWYVGQHYAGSTTPLVTGYFVFGVASLILVLITEKGRLFSVGSPGSH